ncbi:MAG: hypothetical protein KJN60_00865, partial [Boseongicola sp.]|nr:hypothetical protein [Boseongicola sp.]
MSQLVVDQIVSGEVLGLDWGLSDLLYVEVGGRRLIYGLSRTDEKLVAVEMASNGTVSVVDEMALNGPFEVGSKPALGLIDEHLIIAGLPSSAGQFVSLGLDGSFGSQVANADLSSVSAPSVTGSTLVSGSTDGDGLVSYRNGDGSLEWVAALEDDFSTYLDHVTGTVATKVAGVEYVVAISGSENGLTLVEVGTDGSMSAGASFGTLDGLAISQPSDVEAIGRLGEMVLVLAGSGSSSLSTLRVDDGAEVWLSDHILDSTTTRFQAISTVDSITVGDFAYFAAGGVDGGLSLFTVLPGGRMVHLSTLADTSATTLYRVSAISMNYSNGALQILGGSAWEAGLTKLSFDLASQGSVLLASGGAVAGTTLNDQLMGSDLADTISAGSGDDILHDGHGQDTMTGGEGADLFVFAIDGVEDVVLDFERGTDRLDLSGFDFLYDVSQLSITSTANGAVLSYADETIRLFSQDGAALTDSDFSNAGILNVDRPPMLTISQRLVGGDGEDTLNGNTGNDTISGFGGDDLLFGGSGDDHIFGGDGADTLDGGVGHDVIEGGAGSDFVVGGTESDYV